MKALGLRTTIYKVADIDAAKKWFEQAFETEPYFVEPFYVGFNIRGYELGLLPEEGSSSTGDSVHSYWGVEDINAAYKELISLGATSYEAPHNVGDGIMVALVRDPWGNLIGLIYNPYSQVPSAAEPH